MIVGIPNVGKSTFINSFAGTTRAKAANKPGVTRGKQWISVDNFDLMDMPGVLWKSLTRWKRRRTLRSSAPSATISWTLRSWPAFCSSVRGIYPKQLWAATSWMRRRWNCRP